MLQIVKVDSNLADEVEKELKSIKAAWQYLPMTTDYYNLTKNEQEKRNIEEISRQYPVLDTQKFTDAFYNTLGSDVRTPSRGFLRIRQDQNSRYNKSFPNMAKLVDYLQGMYIPNTHSVKRLIANMQTIRPTYSLNAIHPDCSNHEWITILYYVNNSDGDTYFFEGSECVQRVSPIKGTAAVYPATMLHAGSTPIQTETRIVINMVFGPKK